MFILAGMNKEIEDLINNCKTYAMCRKANMKETLLNRDFEQRLLKDHGSKLV